MKKKIILSLIFVILMGLIATVNCYAATEGSIFTDQGAFEYRVENDNSVGIIKYIGKNGKDITHIVIPSSINGKPVRYIRSDTFKDVTGVTKITIPSTVEDISSSAFNNCQNLNTIEFGTNTNNAPSGGGYLHWASVKDCKNLEEIYVYNYMRSMSNNGVQHFGNPFYGCDNFKIIHGHKGSEAEEYAQSNGLTFMPFTPFKDVDVDNWYYKAVKFSYEKGMIKGYNSTTFAPNDKMTRGMLVTILWRLEGCPSAIGKKKFADVDYNAYYGNAIKWAYDSGVVLGYENGKFGPDDEITREDFVVILARYEGEIYDNSDIFEGSEQDLSKFKDNKDVDRYALKRMQWAVRTGIITGNDDGTLNPRGTATRAEAAAILQKYNNKVVAKR